MEVGHHIRASELSSSCDTLGSDNMPRFGISMFADKEWTSSLWALATDNIIYSLAEAKELLS